MVHFNELCIKDGHLIIDVSVLDGLYYDSVYLDSIVIDNQDTYTGGTPSSTPVYQYTVPDIESRFTGQSVSQKHVRLALDSSDVDIADMLFVYVRTKGAPSPDTPCGLDKDTTLGVVVDMLPYYTQGMQYLSELGDRCAVPSGFMDFILETKALELCMRTGNYIKAIGYFKNFKTGAAAPAGGCGCGNN